LRETRTASAPLTEAVTRRTASGGRCVGWKQRVPDWTQEAATRGNDGVNPIVAKAEDAAGPRGWREVFPPGYSAVKPGRILRCGG